LPVVSGGLAESINLSAVRVWGRNIRCKIFVPVFSLFSRSLFNGSEFDCVVEPEFILVLKIQDCVQLARKACPEMVE
jgi:hypothetical protein